MAWILDRLIVQLTFLHTPYSSLFSHIFYILRRTSARCYQGTQDDSYGFCFHAGYFLKKHT